MTVHMIRYLCDENADQELIDGIGDFLDNHQQWADGEPNVKPELYSPVPDDPPDMVPYYAADWRFDWSANRNNMTDRLDRESDGRASWYQIAYHVCDHDEEDREGCSWDETIPGGTEPIPDPVPTVTIPDDSEK